MAIGDVLKGLSMAAAVPSITSTQMGGASGGMMGAPLVTPVQPAGGGFLESPPKMVPAVTVTPVLNNTAPPAQLFGNVPPSAAAAAALPQAIMQASGAGPAQTYLGSVLGAGLGGTAAGTGPLPGALGIAANEVYGTPAMPALKFQFEASGPLARVIERLGRALLFRLLGVPPTTLDEFRIAFGDSLMIQDPATWRAHVLTLMRELSQIVQYGPRAAAASFAVPVVAGTSAPVLPPLVSTGPVATAVPVVMGTPTTPYAGGAGMPTAVPAVAVPAVPTNAGYYQR